MCVSPKGVYSKDDCGKLTNKDSNHTRRSKQNTYHVVNKNMVRTKEGMPSGASPIFGFLVSLDLPWGALGVPKFGSCHSLFHNPSNLYPKLENFTTQNLNRKSHELH